MNSIMPLLYGFFGAIITMGLFALGAYAGWSANKHFNHAPTSGGPTPFTPTEAEIEEAKRQRKKFQEEQEAFHSVMSYSADMAYGLRAPLQEQNERE